MDVKFYHFPLPSVCCLFSYDFQLRHGVISTVNVFAQHAGNVLNLPSFPFRSNYSGRFEARQFSITRWKLKASTVPKGFWYSQKALSRLFLYRMMKFLFFWRPIEDKQQFFMLYDSKQSIKTLVLYCVRHQLQLWEINNI